MMHLFIIYGCPPAQRQSLVEMAEEMPGLILVIGRNVVAITPNHLQPIEINARLTRMAILRNRLESALVVS